MRENIKYSIIIPIYNAGIALKKCLDSIVCQPYNDYEIILVNDGSTDMTTIQICNEFSEKYTHVNLLNQKNGGCVAARRTGILHSHGDFIAFGDADDYFAENYIDVLHKATENPADIYILNNYLNNVGTENFYIEKDLPQNGYIELDWLYDQILHIKMNAVWDKIYKRGLFGENVNIIPQNIIYGEDVYINNQYLPNVNSVYIYNEAVYYHYVDSLTSVCGRDVTFKRLADASVAFDSLVSIQHVKYCTNDGVEAFKDFYYGYFVRAISSLKKKGILSEEINSKIDSCEIMKDISVKKGKNIKSKIYRFILKYKLFKFASWICS